MRRGSFCWLLLCVLAPGTSGAAADPPPRTSVVRVAWQEAEVERNEGPEEETEEREEEHEGEHEGEEGGENLVLILLVVHGSWIIPLVAWIVIARRLSRKREEKRTNALTEVANNLGLSFLDGGNEALQSRLAHLPLFNIGRAKQLTNLIAAETPEVQITLFDYRYITGRGRSRRVRRQTVAAVESPALTIPSFSLRPERKLDAIGSLLGKQDIDFADHPQFSKAFVLKSDSEQETRGFFDRALLDDFAAHPNISFEAGPGVFLYFVKWTRVSPETKAMQEFLAEGYQTLQALQERLTRN